MSGGAGLQACAHGKTADLVISPAVRPSPRLQVAPDRFAWWTGPRLAPPV